MTFPSSSQVVLSRDFESFSSQIVTKGEALEIDFGQRWGEHFLLHKGDRGKLERAFSGFSGAFEDLKGLIFELEGRFEAFTLQRPYGDNGGGDGVRDGDRGGHPCTMNPDVSNPPQRVDGGFMGYGGSAYEVPGEVHKDLNGVRPPPATTPTHTTHSTLCPW